MIGVLGVPKASPDGVAENAAQVGNIFVPQPLAERYDKYEYDNADGLYDVDYLNGMIIITDRDLPWREDLFDGWDFYDASQGMEFKKKGYRVVVPEQRLAWCLHEEGNFTRWSYDRYRRIFINEYLA